MHTLLQHQYTIHYMCSQNSLGFTKMLHQIQQLHTIHQICNTKHGQRMYEDGTTTSLSHLQTLFRHAAANDFRLDYSIQPHEILKTRLHVLCTVR